MIYTDSHVHTSFSSDSDTPMEEMILAAIDAGLTSLCFTEHYDPCFPDTEDHLDFLLDYDQYEECFLLLKEKYKDQIALYHGVELGVQPHLTEECRNFYKKYGSRYDYILHSTHVVDDQDPYYGTYFASFASGKEAIAHYFDIMWENLQIYENYHSLAHLDYICRYEPQPQTPFLYEDYQEILDKILFHIIAEGKSLEINTAGWKYGMEDPNPNEQILRRYRELGGHMITIGSDGHKTEHLAYDFHRLKDYLKEIGFTSYLFYIEGNPVEIGL